MPDLPRISVIIPNINQADTLQSALDALSRQTAAREDIEVIVVDNGSSDRSAQVARAFDARLFTYTQEKNPYICRNIGITHAAAPYILLLDSTCVPDAGMLEAFYTCLRETGADIATGNLVYVYSDPPTLSEMVDSLSFMRNREYTDTRQTYPGSGLFMEKATFYAVGKFREDLRSGADGEWTGRAARGGKVFVYAENARFYYKGRPFRDLLRKAHRIGWGHGTLARESGRYAGWRSLLGMRPPAPWYVKRVIRERGRPEFFRRSVAIWAGMWVYRLCFQLGKMHVARRFSRRG